MSSCRRTKPTTASLRSASCGWAVAIAESDAVGHGVLNGDLAAGGGDVVEVAIRGSGSSITVDREAVQTLRWRRRMAPIMHSSPPPISVKDAGSGVVELAVTEMSVRYSVAGSCLPVNSKTVELPEAVRPVNVYCSHVFAVASII